jgi:hypothetical protein
VVPLSFHLFCLKIFFFNGISFLPFYYFSFVCIYFNFARLLFKLRFLPTSLDKKNSLFVRFCQEDIIGQSSVVYLLNISITDTMPQPVMKQQQLTPKPEVIVNFLTMWVKNCIWHLQKSNKDNIK